MESSFSFLNSGFFTKAEVYPGSLGTFRYRFKREGWIGSGRIQAWVYAPGWTTNCQSAARSPTASPFPGSEANPVKRSRQRSSTRGKGCVRENLSGFFPHDFNQLRRSGIVHAALWAA